MQLLLCAAATIDGPEGHGGAPLLHAAYKNFASICEILLDSGANPHVAFTKSGHIQLEIPAAKTPLHDDHWHRILCEPSQGGSSLQQLRTEGVTALHLAAWHGSARTCHWAKNAGCFWYIVFGLIDCLPNPENFRLGLAWSLRTARCEDTLGTSSSFGGADFGEYLVWFVLSELVR